MTSTIDDYFDDEKPASAFEDTYEQIDKHPGDTYMDSWHPRVQAKARQALKAVLQESQAGLDGLWGVFRDFVAEQWMAELVAAEIKRLKMELTEAIRQEYGGELKIEAFAKIKEEIRCEISVELQQKYREDLAPEIEISVRKQLVETYAPSIRAQIVKDLRPSIEHELRDEIRRQLLADPALREEAVRHLKRQVLDLT